MKKSATGISNVREYQMLWRHLAYRHSLPESFEVGAEPLVSIILVKFRCYSNLLLGKISFLKLVLGYVGRNLFTTSLNLYLTT